MQTAVQLVTITKQAMLVVHGYGMKLQTDCKNGKNTVQIFYSTLWYEAQ